MIALAAKQFRGVGSLTFDSDGKIVVGPLLARQYKVTQGARLGVYATTAQCKLARLDHLFRLVREKKLSWETRWKRTEPDPIWVYVILLEAQELVRGCEEMHCEEPTYIRHTDDHGGQFLLRDDWRLSAVIDWEL